MSTTSQIKFNPENKSELTYSECLEPAMKIMDQFVANRYLKDYIAYTEKMLQIEPSKKGMTAEDICKTNLAYWAGYYDNPVRARVEHLFQCSHPIFGSIADSKEISIMAIRSLSMQDSLDYNPNEFFDEYSNDD